MQPLVSSSHTAQQGGSDVMINHVLAFRRHLSTLVFTWSKATGEDDVAHRVSCRKATLANVGRCRAPLAGPGRASSLCKNGGRRKVPMNEVLTATLQAVRMSTSADGPVWRFCRGKPYRSRRPAFTHAATGCVLGFFAAKFPQFSHGEWERASDAAQALKTELLP
jgi:hypothetical protein